MRVAVQGHDLDARHQAASMPKVDINRVCGLAGFGLEQNRATEPRRNRRAPLIDRKNKALITMILRSGQATGKLCFENLGQVPGAPDELIKEASLCRGGFIHCFTLGPAP